MKRLPFVVYPHPKYNGAEKICSILLPTYWERCIHVTRCGGQCVDNLSLYCEQTDSERARLCYWSQGGCGCSGFYWEHMSALMACQREKGMLGFCQDVWECLQAPCLTVWHMRPPESFANLSGHSPWTRVADSTTLCRRTVNVALKESTTYNEERTPPPDKMVLVTGDFLLLWRTYAPF